MMLRMDEDSRYCPICVRSEFSAPSSYVTLTQSDCPRTCTSPVQIIVPLNSNGSRIVRLPSTYSIPVKNDLLLYSTSTSPLTNTTPVPFSGSEGDSVSFGISTK